MNFEITGKLVEKSDALQVTETFRKREFVLLTEENINSAQGPRVLQEFLKFQLSQAKCELLDAYPINADIKVSFNLRGRKWEKEGRGGYITSLEAWRIEQVAPVVQGGVQQGAQYPQQSAPYQQQYSNTYTQPQPTVQQVPSNNDFAGDDLPF